MYVLRYRERCRLTYYCLKVIKVKHSNTSGHCFSKTVGIASKALDLVEETLTVFPISYSVAGWTVASSRTLQITVHCNYNKHIRNMYKCLKI